MTGLTKDQKLPRIFFVLIIKIWGWLLSTHQVLLPVRIYTAYSEFMCMFFIDCRVDKQKELSKMTNKRKNIGGGPP